MEINYKDINIKRDELLKKQTTVNKMDTIVSIASFVFIISIRILMSETSHSNLPKILVIICIYTFVFLIPSRMTYKSKLKKELQQFSNECKRLFVRDRVSSYFTNGEYDEKGLSKNQFDKTYLFMDYSYYSSSDLIIGNYNNVHFSFSDVKLERVKNGKKPSSELIFNGYLFTFDSNLYFDSYTFIHKIDVSVNNQMYDHGYSNYSGPKLQTVKFESNEFNTMFEVKTSNGIDAYSFLSPRMMESLIDLGQKQNFAVSLHGDKIDIVISTDQDLFEFPISLEINNHLKNNFDTQFKKMCDLIETISNSINFKDQIIKVEEG